MIPRATYLVGATIDLELLQFIQRNAASGQALRTARIVQPGDVECKFVFDPEPEPKATRDYYLIYPEKEFSGVPIHEVEPFATISEFLYLVTPVVSIANIGWLKIRAARYLLVAARLAGATVATITITSVGIEIIVVGALITIAEEYMMCKSIKTYVKKKYGKKIRDSDIKIKYTNSSSDDSATSIQREHNENK